MTRLLLCLCLTLTVSGLLGCGSEPPPAKTPELTSEQKDAMKKSMEGGGGPAMIQKMKTDGKSKPD